MTKDLSLLILRLTGLGLALGHGWGKVIALAAGEGRFIDSVASLGFPAPAVFAWMAALSELVGGVFVALGLSTRVAAAFAAATMAVAAFVRHHAHVHIFAWLGWTHVSEETLKGWGNPELALVYLAGFLAVAVAGPGDIALDTFVKRKK